MQLNIGWIFNTLELYSEVTTIPEKVNPNKAVRLEQKLKKTHVKTSVVCLKNTTQIMAETQLNS